MGNTSIHDSGPKEHINMAPQVFFITGTSTGFGYELVKKCLETERDKVVATARNSSKVQFDGATKDNFLAVDCDVTDQKSIDNAFDKAIAQFGRIDKQIRTQMEVNFFGLLNVTRKALQVMREVNKPCCGKIQQITSIGGQRGVPTFSIYCASKWAVEGYT